MNSYLSARLSQVLSLHATVCFLNYPGTRRKSRKGTVTKKHGCRRKRRTIRTDYKFIFIVSARFLYYTSGCGDGIMQDDWYWSRELSDGDPVPGGKRKGR